jgi:hypothetical protein
MLHFLLARLDNIIVTHICWFCLIGRPSAVSMGLCEYAEGGELSGVTLRIRKNGVRAQETQEGMSWAVVEVQMTKYRWPKICH